MNTASGLPAGPPISASETTFRWLARPYAFLDECAATLGDRFTLQFTRFGTHVVVSHPDDVRAVFGADRDSLLAGRGNSLLEPVLGKHSLLLTDGAKHAEQRSLLQPAFTIERVQGYTAAVVAAVRRWTAGWHDGDTVGMQRTALEISKEVILRIVLGLEGEELSSFSEFIHKMMALVGTNATFEESGTETRLLQRFHTVRDAMNEALQNQIERRRGDRNGSDMLSMLLTQQHATPQSMSDDEIRDQLLTMILAGHETTASSITWVMDCVHSDTHAREMLRQELDSATDLDDAKLVRLPYLQAVCLETLRMRPVIPVVSRQLQQPLRLRDCTIPSGVFVTPCAYLAQRRAEFFPEPDAFQPQRFLDRRFPPHAYFPFGGGARRCIGMSFALMELQTVVGMLLREFEFDTPAPVRPVRRAVTIVASGGGKMRVARRRVH